MVESSSLTRAVVGIVLLLGACAEDAPPEGTLAPASPAVIALDAGAVTAVTVRADEPETSLDLEPAEPAIGPADAPLAIAASDDGVESLLRDLKRADEPAAPAPALPPAIVPDGRAAAKAVATRPAGTEVGYLLIDLATGEVLAELNPDLPLIPASTTKLATAVVALDVLGPEHRYRTELLADGMIRQGVLEGNLILRGRAIPPSTSPTCWGSRSGWRRPGSAMSRATS